MGFKTGPQINRGKRQVFYKMQGNKIMIKGETIIIIEEGSKESLA